MANQILKGLAVVAGTGLAIGFGSKRHTQVNSTIDSADNLPAVELLLDRLERIESRIETLRVRMDQRFAEAAKEAPAMLESLLGPHVEDLRTRLHAEMRESIETRLATFEQKLDNKVSVRVATIDKALIDQSGFVTTLSRRALEAEENFQRLISAVERLCERKEQPVLDLPFERQLSEAFQRQPEPSAFRPRIVKEDDGKPRHRNPLASL